MPFQLPSLLASVGLLATFSAFVAAAVFVRGAGADHHARALRLAWAAAALYGAAFASSATALASGSGPSLADWRASVGAAAREPGGQAMLAILVGQFAVAGHAALAASARTGPPQPRSAAAWTLVFGQSLLALVAGAGLLGAWPEISGFGASEVAGPLLAAALRGLAILLGAASLSHILTQDPAWAALALPWARVAFLAAWLGVGSRLVGWIAAYPGRDPIDALGVQGRTPLVLIALVALLHGLIYYRKRRLMGLLSPVAGLAVFLLAVPSPSARHLADLVLAIVASAALVHALMRAGSPAARQDPWMERWFSMDRLVYLGMTLTVAATLAGVAVQTLHRGPSGSDLVVLLALPVLLVLGIALSNRAIGRRSSLATATAALAFGAVFGLVRPDLGLLPVAVPVLLFAFLSAGIKLFKVSDPGPSAGWAARALGGTLLFGAVAGLAFWVRAPPWIDLGPFRFTVQPAGIYWGVPLCGLALLGASSALRERNLRVALVASLALGASAAWGVLAPLGVALTLLFWSRRSRFLEGTDAWNLGSTFSALERDARKTGTYLIHLALVSLLAGLAFLAGPPLHPVPRIGEFALSVGFALVTVGMVFVLFFGGFTAREKGKEGPNERPSTTVK